MGCWLSFPPFSMQQDKTRIYVFGLTRPICSEALEQDKSLWIGPYGPPAFFNFAFGVMAAI